MNIRKFFNSTKCRLKSVFLLSKVKCLKLLEELKNSRKYKPIEEIEETKICKLVDKLTSYKEVKRGGYFILAITLGGLAGLFRRKTNKKV